MVKFFELQIRMGNLAIEQVPEKWRASVEAALECEAAECM